MIRIDRGAGAALTGLLLLCATFAASAVAESFGPEPGPDQSRCAALSANRKILKIGQTIVLHAGPITDQCGGPSSSTSYVWQTTDPASPADAPGLVMLHPCTRNSPVCIYRARLFTQPNIWQGVGITGTSPDGGWGAGVHYAILYGHYIGVGVSVNGFPSEPKRVTLIGHGRHESTTAAAGGGFEFDVIPGTYSFYFTIGHKTHHKTVKLQGRPGSAVSVNITPTP